MTQRYPLGQVRAERAPRVVAQPTNPHRIRQRFRSDDAFWHTVMMTVARAERSRCRVVLSRSDDEFLSVPNERPSNGEMVQYETPNWDPRWRAVHAYKHIDTIEVHDVPTLEGRTP